MTKSIFEEVEADLNREKNEQATDQLAEIWYGNPFTRGRKAIIAVLVIAAVLFAVTGHFITSWIFAVATLLVIVGIACVNKGLEVGGSDS